MKMFSVRLVVPFVFALAFNSFAQTPYYLEDRAVEDKVERLLLKRDVGELANELARRKPATGEDLLINLSVYARAGHRVRVRETLREISKIYSSSPNRDQIFRVAQRAVSGGDLATRKIYYEQFAVGGDNNVSSFMDLWRIEGDVRELENWLKVRAENNETWWQQLVALKKSLGTENEIADELERKIRENPSDFALVQKYLQTVSTWYPTQIGPVNTEYHRDVSWLADVVGKDSAYESYELGMIFQTNFPSAAIKLYEKSLSLAFTQNDAKLLFERAFGHAQIAPDIKNPEKQLRVWTKRELAETYQKTNQPTLAQPIIEDLTTIDMSDIQPENPFALAGAVQASSGQRVVESKILQDEAANENLPAYWINRVSYYGGRKEPDLVWQTFERALGKFSYQPNDLKNSLPRVQILYYLKAFGANYKEDEVREILRREFIEARTNKDAAYLFHLARIISDEFEDLNNEFFVNSNLLPQILADREKWRDEEQFVIENAMDSEKWNKQKREAVWEQLSNLARRDIRNRAYSLTEAMESENRKAIPLLEECLKIAPKENEGDLNFDRGDVERSLFDVYLAVGDWQKAEKMFVQGFRYNGSEPGRIAVAAAKNGRIADALRLWKVNANLDRRNLSNLEELAKTDAKPPLREFYSQMKKTDALTDASDRALLALK